MFCLIPTSDGCDDPDWSTSMHRGPCYVVAPDARRARLYAAGALADPGAERTTGGLRPASPWMRPDLVEAIGPVAACGEEGTVLLPANPREHDGSRVSEKLC